MVRVAVLVALVGCGRFGFGDDGDDPPDAPATDAGIDAAPGIDGGVDAMPDPSLTVHYPMEDDPSDGQIDDASGNGRNAICVAGVTCPNQASGYAGEALQFDGASQLVRIVDNGVFQAPEFTIAAWIKIEDAGFDQVAFAKPYGTGTDDSWGITAWMTMTCLETTVAAGDQDACGGGGLPVDTWFHVAGTFDGIEKVLYVDGVRLGQNPSNEPVVFDGHDVLIGGDENGGNPAYMWHGRVDELRIYDRALSGTEILALAQ
jgi:hypothetical protein